MNPFIRSIAELKAISESKDQQSNHDDKKRDNVLTEDSGQRKRYIRSSDEKSIKLPGLPKTTRRRWIKSKEVMSRFFDELDYNNQIQSSYDLTLIERQKTYDNTDAA